MKRLLLIIGVACLAASLSSAGTVILTFDDLPAGSQVGNQYAAFGVTFSLTDTGIQVGLANGDPGNWGVNGDNGPYFDGFNGNPSYGTTLSFTNPVSNFSLDASRTNGSSDGDSLLVSAFDGATLLGSDNIAFGPVNTWSTFSLPFDGITSVTVQGSGAGYHPFGIDNVQFSNVPEPGAAVLTLTGVSLFLLRRLRRA